MPKSELEKLVKEIKKTTNQIAINKVDEVRVMTCMLNDSEFTLGVYDRTQGYIGQKCPRDGAVKFIKNVISGATGLDQRDSQHLAENYTFTKKDANFLLDNMRDFINVYMGTTRKLNILQTANSESAIFTREIEPSMKMIPDKDNPGKTKSVYANGYNKLVSSSRCPKYAMKSNQGEPVDDDEDDD